MKKINLTTILELAAAVVFMNVPLRADEHSVMASQLAKAAEVSGFSALALESFGNYGVAGLDKVRYAKEELTLGLVKEKGLELMNRSQFGGTDCYQKGWFPKAPLKICPQAVTVSSVFKTPGDLSLTGAGLKENDKGLEKRRTKRVSRLQEPGEAMGGGREKHIREDAEKMVAQNGIGAVVDQVVPMETPSI